MKQQTLQIIAANRTEGTALINTPGNSLCSWGRIELPESVFIFLLKARKLHLGDNQLRLTRELIKLGITFENEGRLDEAAEMYSTAKYKLAIYKNSRVTYKDPNQPAPS